jgi:hypothetical protein
MPPSSREDWQTYVLKTLPDFGSLHLELLCDVKANLSVACSCYLRPIDDRDHTRQWLAERKLKWYVFGNMEQTIFARHRKSVVGWEQQASHAIPGLEAHNTWANRVPFLDRLYSPIIVLNTLVLWSSLERIKLK